MKSLLRLFTPTRNRRFNELIGFVLIASALLLFLALASYSPLDPSLNTASAMGGNESTHNWIGRVGALISDGLLRIFGIAVFSQPVMLGGARPALVPLPQHQFPGGEGAGRFGSADLHSRPDRAAAWTCPMVKRHLD
jgi:hypothetical protein